MKVEVTEMFQDKNTGNYHLVGDVLDVKEQKRADELIACKVVKAIETSKPKKAVKE